MSNVHVRMERADLETLPDWPLPPGMDLRPWCDGDRETWVRLWCEAEPFETITPALFDREFHGDHQALAERMRFLVDEGGAVAGSTVAWYDDEGHQADLGRVHWVVVHPRAQGTGLGRALVSETLRLLARLGHRRAFLHTSTGRPGAIGVYLRAGFTPRPRTEEETVAWRSLATELHGAAGDLLQAHLR